MKRFFFSMALVGLAAFRLSGQTNTSTVRLQKAEPPLTVDLLAELSQRNVLHPSTLTSKQIPIVAAPARNPETVKQITDYLRSQRFSVMLEGEKFMIIVADAATNSIKRLSDEALKAIAKDTGSITNSAIAPRGVIKFTGAPAEQVLEIYAHYSGRKCANLRELSGDILMRQITFRNTTDLTKSEVIYAFEMVLACNGILIVRNEDGTFNAVPSAQ